MLSLIWSKHSRIARLLARLEHDWDEPDRDPLGRLEVDLRRPCVELFRTGLVLEPAPMAGAPPSDAAGRGGLAGVLKGFGGRLEPARPALGSCLIGSP